MTLGYRRDIAGTMNPYGYRVLYVRTTEAHSEQLYAIDHYALIAKKNGVKVALLGSELPKSYTPHIPSLGSYPALTGNVFSKITKLFLRYISFSSAVIRYKPNIVHVKNHIGASLLPVILKFLRPSAKAILDIRTLSPTPKKDMFFKKSRKINTFLFSHVFGLNDLILATYTQNGINTSKLPLGYDDEIFGRISKLAYSPGDRLRCLYYGSMNRVRSLEKLVLSVIAMLEQGYDIVVDFVGEGDDKTRLASMIPLEYRDSVRFLPFRAHRELVYSLGNYNLGLAYIPFHDALAPNIPLKTVEMIAAGLPVLATRTPGNIDVMSHQSGCGIFVDDTIESISAGFKHVFESDFMSNHKAENCRNMMMEFSWDALASVYLFPVYDSLVKQ